MSLSFPLALHLDGRRCLVVGSGPAACERARQLLGAGARVRLVANLPSADIEALASDVDLLARAYESTDLDDCWLAVLTDPDPEQARRIAADAESRRIFFCAVDQPAYGSYSHLAIARAASVFVAVGSEGAVPALSRRLREEIQRLMHEANLAAFVERLAARRAALPRTARAQAMRDAVRGVGIAGRLVLPSDAPSDDTDGPNGPEAEPR